MCLYVKIMGFNFSFWGKQQHRVFNYRPRYYDPKKEELKQKFGKVDGSEKKGENYAPGSILKGSMRGGNYQKTKEVTKSQQVLGAIGLILFFMVLYLFAKYYPMLTDSIMNEPVVEEVAPVSPDAPEDDFQIVYQ